jgi:Tat protein translocase TatB subunit
VQFLGVGWQEVLVIGILAFFVIGPERMPVVAYQIGRAVRTLQQYARAVRDEFGEELGYVEEQYKTIRGDFDEARRELREQQRVIEAEWRTQQTEIESGLKDAQQAVEGAAKVVSITERANGAVSATRDGAPGGALATASALTASAPGPGPGAGDVGPPLVF